MCIQCGSLEAHIKTNRASGSSFGFPLQAFDSLKPIIRVIIGVNVLHSDLLTKLLILTFSDFIFSFGVNIRVVKENRRRNP